MTVDPSQQLPDYVQDVGSGWHPIIARLHEELLRVAPGYVARQVKEKFGALRIYLDYELGVDADAAEVLLEAAEAESLRTCEFCGAPGRPTSSGWIKTTCDGCRTAGPDAPAAPPVTDP